MPPKQISEDRLWNVAGELMVIAIEGYIHNPGVKQCDKDRTTIVRKLKRLLGRKVVE